MQCGRKDATKEALAHAHEALQQYRFHYYRLSRAYWHAKAFSLAKCDKTNTSCVVQFVHRAESMANLPFTQGWWNAS